MVLEVHITTAKVSFGTVVPVREAFKTVTCILSCLKFLGYMACCFFFVAVDSHYCCLAFFACILAEWFVLPALQALDVVC